MTIEVIAFLLGMVVGAGIALGGMAATFFVLRRK
jgi:hypothetical protein